MSVPVVASEFPFPLRSAFLDELGLQVPASVEALLKKALFDPLDDFRLRSGKQFRARLVEIGYRLAIPESGGSLSEAQSKHCAMLAEIIEALHAGALIIDDIQDGSTLRRNAPAFHLRHGVGKSINAANWLYFWPLAQIQEMSFAPDRELLMIRECLNVMNFAHIGQAIDISTPIDEVPQAEVETICLTSIRLKTGVLMSLAVSLGALAAGAPLASARRLGQFGCELGLALQKFDDASTFSLEKAHLSKRYEDLYLKRPSWVWAFASRRCSERDYGDFVRAARNLPDESYLKAWVGAHDFGRVLREASKDDLKVTLSHISDELGGSHPNTVRGLIALGEELERSYG